MKLADVHNLKDYLCYYDMQIDWATIKLALPKTHALYRSLCKSFLELCDVRPESMFLLLKELLCIDAQLQILSQLLKMYDPWYEHFTDEELVHIVTTDKDCFYREIVGLTLTSQPPWGLMFLSERMSDES